MSAIEWTDRTWNPVRGCSMARGSETGGCLNCYAAAMASRNLPEMRSPTTGEAFARKTASGPRWTGRVELIPEKLDEPLRWRKPSRVFVNSMSDLFHEALPDAVLLRVLDVIRQNECRDEPHILQVLTKRPERMRAVMSRLQFDAAGAGRMWLEDRGKAKDGVPIGIARIFRHLWLGVSVEDQRTADERIPLLLETPAAVRFVSYEPALGPVNFAGVRDPVRRTTRGAYLGPCLHADENGDLYETSGLDWVIVGGESGPGARPCDVAWIRSVVRQCREAGVACFVKQAGSNVRTRNDSLSTEHDPDIPTYWPEPLEGWGRIDEDLDGYRDGYQGAPVRIHLMHPKGGDMSEWPKDLRVREFPA